MNQIVGLDTLNPGEMAKVVTLNTIGTMRRRFMDIGIVPGTKILCEGISPCGDPKAFQICGAVMAIRREDSQSVLVCRI